MLYALLLLRIPVGVAGAVLGGILTAKIYLRALWVLLNWRTRND